MRVAPTMMALATALVSTGCVGISKRETSMMVGMSFTWTAEIAEDVERGLQAGVASGQFSEGQAELWRAEAAALTEALASGDRTQVIGIDWPALRRLALDGIQVLVDRGEITTGGAASFIETVNRFDQNLLTLISREAP